MDVTERLAAGRPVGSAVVVNPAKVDDLAGFRASVDGALTGAGWPAPQWYETTPGEPGRAQTAAAVEAGAEIVFVAGGDGTIRSAVSALVGTDTAMAVLPAGTGNLLAANLGLSTDVATGLEVALEGGLRRLDVGVVDGQHFTVMAGMGFDARMLDATSDTAKARIGWPAYVLGALRHVRDRRMNVTVRIDGGEPIRRRAHTVLVANVGRLQGGVRLLTEAKPDDGLLDVAILTPRTLRHWLALGWAVFRREGRVPSMEVVRGARVEVASDRVQPRQLDGDLIEAGRLLNVQVLRKVLWLCVPQPAGHPDLAEDADAAAERGHRIEAASAEQPTDDLASLLRLPDGTPARLRAVVGTDRQLLQDMYAALSQVSRRGRFLAAPPRLTELTLDHLVDAVDQVDHVAVLLLAPAGHPDEAPVGVGRMIRYAGDPATADISFAVGDDWQGRGVGSALARALVAHRPPGVTRLVTVVTADNRASLATLAGLGAIERVLNDGVYNVTVTLPT